MTGKLPSLVQPSDCYPVLLFHVGGDEATMHSPRAIKRDFRALGWLLGESGAQVIFSSLPAVGSKIPQRHSSRSSHPASSGTQLKCLYANARSTGNKQEKWKTCAHLQGYDLIGIPETWWDGSYDWSVGMEGYRLFRKARQGRRGRGVTLYINDQLECMELHMGMDEEPTKSLWVRIKGSTGAGNITTGVCYRAPDQGD
ncbi:hypothetical protein GRJ2_002089900 [Grus japonensis]|uniref:Uncharacterized protein n=1 Tax=Grus japonensis TaxID=30415 RepID=A0ABC9XFA5_GRUJA